MLLNRLAIPFLLLFFVVGTTIAGESVRPARQEFRMRKTYPFVFEPVPYLENGAPPPLRFGDSSDECSRHNPPLLSPEAKGDKPEPTPAPKPTPAESDPKAQSTPAPSPAAANSSTTTEAKPAYPPPTNGQPAPSADSLDMSQYPDEVVDYFKDPYNLPKSRKHFFEPIFEPAVAPNPNPIPKPSKATYRQE